MGYRQLSIEERCEIARLRAEGASVREVARRLDRAASTVTRELRRNASPTGGYRPSVAHDRAWGRRWCGPRLERDEELRADVLGRLRRGCSPEQVAGQLARAEGRKVISYESVYRFVYGQSTRGKDYGWRRYLPQGKWKRGRRGRKGGSSASFISLRRPIAERPLAAADHQTCGHWEADTMLFGRSGEVVLALHERHSRLVIAARAPSKAAGPIAETIAGVLGPLPPVFRQTVTFDNGTEFAVITSSTVWASRPSSATPTRRGGVENAIGRLRRFLPRKTVLADVSEERFTLIMQTYNNTPRKCLGYRTPAEVFMAQVLHFKCESTFPLSRV